MGGLIRVSFGYFHICDEFPNLSRYTSAPTNSLVQAGGTMPPPRNAYVVSPKEIKLAKRAMDIWQEASWNINSGSSLLGSVNVASSSRPSTLPSKPLRTDGHCYDVISSAALSLRILFLNGLGVLFLGGAGVIMEDALFEERVGGWSVCNLFVQGVGAHVLLELARECEPHVPAIEWLPPEYGCLPPSAEPGYWARPWMQAGCFLVEKGVSQPNVVLPRVTDSRQDRRWAARGADDILSMSSWRSGRCSK